MKRHFPRENVKELAYCLAKVGKCLQVQYCPAPPVQSTVGVFHALDLQVHPYRPSL